MTASSSPLDAPQRRRRRGAIPEMRRGGGGGTHASTSSPRRRRRSRSRPCTTASSRISLAEGLAGALPGDIRGSQVAPAAKHETSPRLLLPAAGAVGECVGSVVRVPAEAIKSTRQADGPVTAAGARRQKLWGLQRAK